MIRTPEVPAPKTKELTTEEYTALFAPFAAGTATVDSIAALVTARVLTFEVFENKKYIPMATLHLPGFGGNGLGGKLSFIGGPADGLQATTFQQHNENYRGMFLGWLQAHAGVKNSDIGSYRADVVAGETVQRHGFGLTFLDALNAYVTAHPEVV